MTNADSTQPPGREPVDEGLPPDLPPGVRRAERMRLVAGRRLGGLRVVLDGVHDRHNISAVLRSCEGFGLQHVHLIGPEGELQPNRAITCGCEKWLDLHYHETPEACLAELHEAGFAVYAALPARDARSIEAIDFLRPTALAFGAEKFGLSDAFLAGCDGRFVVPMAGFSQSLNVSVAAAVSVYVASGLRRTALKSTTDMTDDEVEALAERWIAADRGDSAT